MAVFLDSMLKAGFREFVAFFSNNLLDKVGMRRIELAEMTYFDVPYLRHQKQLFASQLTTMVGIRTDDVAKESEALVRVTMESSIP